ncbi:hypothetical protein GII36_03515 [Candidatus Mycosynbacter amalyticus]|uniref:Uncharacterized protein n=1 Tax=Candidatus Mycosynbacter amalyticus TaxID=2665156 RepID=A0A857MK27_9BACT|nr:hypothetical protein [Candidatus Mycosynbacter amalyticus]QHN42906.1 hypothetical protein GII36_03515 [Candidatus Mycosynbacter amalyticus]
MSNTLRIVIERHPNTELTSFHVNRRLTDSKHTIRFAHDSGQVVVDNMFSEVNVEPLAQLLAENIYEIPGIQTGFIGGGVSIENYKVSVSHSRAFDENDIEFAVIEAVAKTINIELDDVTFELDDYARSDEYKQRQRESERAYARMF